MLSPKQFRGVVLVALSICASLLLTSPARAQKIELQTCEDLNRVFCENDVDGEVNRHVR